MGLKWMLLTRYSSHPKIVIMGLLNDGSSCEQVANKMQLWFTPRKTKEILSSFTILASLLY